MSLEPAVTQKLNTLEPIYCPSTGKRIVAENHKRFTIPNAQVTWFECEACRGWHIVIDNIAPDGPVISPEQFLG